MQNDFVSTGGSFDRSGVDISMIQKAVAPTAGVLAAARKAGIKVVYVNMGFQPDLSDLGAPESPNRVRHLMFGVGANVTAPDGTASRCLVVLHRENVFEARRLTSVRFSGYSMEPDWYLNPLAVWYRLNVP